MVGGSAAVQRWRCPGPRPLGRPRFAAAEGFGFLPTCCLLTCCLSVCCPAALSWAVRELFAVRPRTTPMNSSIQACWLSIRQAKATVVAGASVTVR